MIAVEKYRLGVAQREAKSAFKKSNKTLKDGGVVFVFPTDEPDVHREVHISLKEFTNMTSAIMHVNLALERSSPQKLKAPKITFSDKEIVNNAMQFVRDSDPTDITFSALSYIIAKDPLNPEVYMHAGNIFISTSPEDPYDTLNIPARNNMTALASFANASRLQPGFTEAHEGMEIALDLISSSKEAEEVGNKNFEKLIKGNILLNNGQYEKGIQLLKDIPHDSSYAWLAYKKAADALFGLGKRKAAARAIYDSALLLIQTGDFQTAKSFCEFSAKVRQDIGSFYTLGRVCEELGLNEQADEAFGEASNIKPKTRDEALQQVEAMYRRRMILWRNGMHQEADALFKKAIEKENQIRRHKNQLQKAA